MENLEIGRWIDECMCALCIQYGPGSLGMPVSHSEAVVVLVGHFLDSFVVAANPGGFYPFYSEHALETVAALDEIGLTEAARLLEEVNSMFPHGSPPVDGKEAERELDLLPARATVLWDKLDEMFQECTSEGEGVMITQLYNWYNQQAKDT
jgi:Domain of unknown function (DUF4375)